MRPRFEYCLQRSAWAPPQRYQSFPPFAFSLFSLAYLVGPRAKDGEAMFKRRQPKSNVRKHREIEKEEEVRMS